MDANVLLLFLKEEAEVDGVDTLALVALGSDEF
jgi:hypothetical protein